MKFDVVVAGAGPAGAVAALVLARAGARVRLVDRARFPRDKLCGDTVNPGAVAVLRRLGLDHTVACGLELAGMLVTGPGGVAVRGTYGGRDGAETVGRALVRREFDMALVEAAVAAGARFDDATHVRAPIIAEGSGGLRVVGVELATARGAAESARAPVTVAADGRGSVVGVALGLASRPVRPRRWVVGGYYTDVDALGPYGEMHVRRGHFVGVAPLPGGLANVCVVSADRRRFADPAAFLHRVLSADVTLRDRFRTARLTAPVVSLGPLALDLRAAGAPGLLLAGDAAGFVDPMTGDGLRFALRGGELAARAALDALADGSDRHERLTRWRQAEFGGKWRFNRAVRRLVAVPLALSVASAASAVAPAILRRAIRYAGDTAVREMT